MQEPMSDFTALLIIFVVFIVPLWLILYFRHKDKVLAGSLANEDRVRLQELEQQANHLKQRLKTLEKILQDLDPNWRGD